MFDVFKNASVCVFCVFVAQVAVVAELIVNADKAKLAECIGNSEISLQRRTE